MCYCASYDHLKEGFSNKYQPSLVTTTRTPLLGRNKKRAVMNLKPKSNGFLLFPSSVNIHCPPVHSETETQDVDTPDAEVTGQRFTRDVLDHAPVNDYVSGAILLPHVTRGPHRDIQ